VERAAVTGPRDKAAVQMDRCPVLGAADDPRCCRDGASKGMMWVAGRALAKLKRTGLSLNARMALLR